MLGALNHSLIFALILIAKNLFACPVIDSIIITPATCKYSSDAVVVVYASGSGSFQYSIDGGQNFFVTNVFSGLTTGNYIVMVRANACVDAIQTITITDNSFLSSSFQVTQTSGNMPLNSTFFNTSFGASSLTWDFGDGSQQVSNEDTISHTYNVAGQYQVLLIVSNGVCSDSSMQTITVVGESSLLIPNVFSPNGDEVNDFFRPVCSGIKSLEGKIYNRYGNLVYEWKGVRGGWDGYTAPTGIEVVEGTYFYIIKAEGIDGKNYNERGILTLIR